MKALPSGWRIHPPRGPDHRLQVLNRRFRALSRRCERVTVPRRIRRFLSRVVLGVGAVVVLYALAKPFLIWPPMTALKHIVAAPNCDAARTVGLAPATRGNPGYYARHDRDGDGTACEPFPPRHRGHGFIKG